MAFKNHSEETVPVESSTSHPSICDYEGSTYRTDFWTQDRTYEDAAERIALKALLPPAGGRLIEIGAGFGRLADLYTDYDQVILFDYSRSLLKEARAQWGEHGPLGRPRYIYVAGDFNRFPFVDGLFDTVTMVRVIHHAPDAPRVLDGIGEIIAPGGTFVLEFANKRNLKAIGRWLLKRQSWSPFDSAPYEFAELNYDFHPHWMQTQLRQAGFVIQSQRTVSHFRLGVLKRYVQTQWLAKLDGLVQPTGRWWQLAPSIFVASRTTKTSAESAGPDFFRCSACRGIKLVEQTNALMCQTCHQAWPIHDGLYDFKEPL
jgi:ubiquinone/menaquinone biosynthesis C-methylase UbiE